MKFKPINQEDQEATNAESIEEEHCYEEAWSRGIFNDHEVVGFLMLSID